jgi:hypothetical protein
VTPPSLHSTVQSRSISWYSIQIRQRQRYNARNSSVKMTDVGSLIWPSTKPLRRHLLVLLEVYDPDIVASGFLAASFPHCTSPSPPSTGIAPHARRWGLVSPTASASDTTLPATRSCTTSKDMWTRKERLSSANCVGEYQEWHDAGRRRLFVQ